MSHRIHGCQSTIVALGTAFLLNACSPTVNWNFERTPSTAFAEPQTTSVGALFQEAVDQHPGLSGFSLIREGDRAFMARLAMADLAEKSLDAQYYIWDGDTTGKILADHLMRAADRGVHVRVLIDDHYRTQATDFGLAVLDAHPNIEIRFFNPVPNRGWRMPSFAGDFSRVNHRMHNKLFVMDNAVGIVGGRNIADVYFGVRADHNYRDLDVLTVGPIVSELSAAFDLFWNSEWAIPVGAVVSKPTEQELRAAMQQLEAQIAATGYPYPIYENVTDLRARLVRFATISSGRRAKCSWRTRAGDHRRRHGVIVQRWPTGRCGAARVVDRVALFRAGGAAYRGGAALTAHGVTVRALTNSAISNDVLPAHAGYANTRKELLRAGMELYELRPDSNMKRQWSMLAGSSGASLHAKSLVFDRQTVFIGSFNLDPRSTTLNTEIGVMIDSPEIARQVGELMDEGVTPGQRLSRDVGRERRPGVDDGE